MPTNPLKYPLPLAVVLGFLTVGLHAQSPTPDPQLNQLESLIPRVAALSGEGAHGQVNAVLSVALERAKACLDVGDSKDAGDLISDVEATLAKNPQSLVAPSSQTNTISALRPPMKVDGNPYIAKLVAGANEDLSKPDKPFLKNTPMVNSFSGLGGETGSRSSGDEMQAWLWLYANPASPLKGDSRVLERYLRVANAYADAIDIHGSMSLAGSSASTEAVKGAPLVGAQGSKGNENAPLAGQGIFDDFAIAPASCALREFAQLYPGLLLPSQKALWDRAMKTGGAVMWLKAKDRQGTYANIDLALAFEMLNFGLYLDNKEYLDKARFLYEAQEKIIWPDGALAYLGHQNESANYHNSDTRDLTRIYEVNQDPKVLELLKKTEWYGPVTCGKRGEFWTVPSWKDTWNDTTSIWTGGESVAALTGNPYLRGMNDKLLTGKSDPYKWPSGWYAARLGLPWWRDDVKPLPLPDNYTVIDRNIAGPRAWYGRFNYAATTRPIPESEPGLATIMGAQVIGEDGGMGNVLMGVYPRIRENKQELSKDGKYNRSAFAWRTYGLKSAVVTGRTFSAVAGTYQLQQYQSSQPGKPVDWSGRQLWLGLPDRIIGLVEISPTKEGATAIDVEGVLRLGTGGTVNGKATKIEQTGTNSWKYGDLSVTMIAHNGAKIETPEVPYRLPKFPNTEIRVMDEKGAAGAAAPTAYPASFNHWMMVEIRPSWVTTPAVVSRIDDPVGILGFKAQIESKQFQLLFNSRDNDLRCSPTVSVNTSLHDSVTGVQVSIPGSLNLKPNELAVLVASPAKEDHLQGWANFQEMLGQLPSTR
jgi:hypothetical protein